MQINEHVFNFYLIIQLKIFQEITISAKLSNDYCSKKMINKLQIFTSDNKKFRKIKITYDLFQNKNL